MDEPRPPPHPEKGEPLGPGSLAAEGLGAQGQQGLAQRLARYGTAKTRNHAMAGHLCKEGLRPLADRLYRCGAFLRFRHYLERRETRLVESRSCDVSLLCPLCAIRRGGRFLRRYHERIEQLTPLHDFHTVTLTVKNGPDLAERFAHLRRSFRRLRDRAKKGYGELARTTGALWSFEFTKSEHGWHPHVHMIVAVPKGSRPIYWGKDSPLGQDWLAATGDSFIVHARPIEGSEEQRIAALCESLKYALKFSTLSLDDNLAAFFTLKGKRLLASSGCFYGVVKEDEQLDDAELDEPYIEWLFRYAGARGYVLTNEGLDRLQGDGTIPRHGGPSHAHHAPLAAVDSVQGHDHARAAPAAEGGRAPPWPGAGDAWQHGDRAVRRADASDSRSG